MSTFERIGVLSGTGVALDVILKVFSTLGDTFCDFEGIGGRLEFEVFLGIPWETPG